MSPRSLKTVLKTLAGAAVAAPCLAVSGAHGQADFTSQVLSASCPLLVAPILSEPQLKPVLAARPVEIAAVCDCAARAASSDPRLRPLLGASEESLREQLRQGGQRSYFMTRILQSSLMCFSVELERSLESFGRKN